MRSLPQVTGPTESTLGALLERQLAPSQIPDRLAWIAINAAAIPGVDGVAPARAEIEALVDDRTRCGADAAAGAVSRLRALGLLDTEGRLTGAGTDELAATRGRVAAATATLTEGLPEADVTTAIAVLDHVRSRADGLLRA